MSPSTAGNTLRHNVRLRIQRLSAGTISGNASETLNVSDTQSSSSRRSSASSALRIKKRLLDIFGVGRKTRDTAPAPTVTSQLAYCYSLIARSHNVLMRPAEDIPTTSFLNNNEIGWVQETGRVERDQLRWLVDQLIKAFSNDTLNGSDAVAEIVLLGPVLDSETYRSLLSCFITKFENTTPFDVNLLQGLIQLVECASIGYLVDSDLVRIADVLSKELAATRNSASDHASHLT
ncbi:hypothetical protein EC957_008299 [Mortierella hygrophila]|uniref:Arm-like repeat domain-containing protein n=1 Tax=Mortierella hygrophila TaxID=979708 RepID=A0A9P6EXP6_9FUNG|nr:hypothetical protein EC957_008299 [Mortierella hygrophila]